MATHKTNTSLYKFNHTMLRVKDPKETVEFYKKHFGMTVVNKLDFEEAKFSLYFLACDSAQADSHGKTWTAREGILELTHNYGTENDPNYKVASGNSDEAKGFGHIAFTVNNLEDACNTLESSGVKFQKKLSDGRSRHLAFALDPNGYWIELISLPEAKKTPNSPADPTTYRLNHTMLRVKDPEIALNFYRSTLGMSLLNTIENPDAKFNLYFLGYRRPTDKDGDHQTLMDREGLLELTWNYGTESDEAFKYHNGNEEPQGFGHICVAVDDLDEACARFEDLGVKWKKRLTDGRMKNVAFVLDPDGYWVEIIQNETLKERAKW